MGYSEKTQEANGVNGEVVKVREKIDAIDAKLVEMLNQRAQLALDAAKLKKAEKLPPYAPEREQAVLDTAVRLNQGPLSNTSVRNVISEVISACRAVQRNVRVAFLGPMHTFSHQAVLRRFGASCELSPQDTIAEVFAEVERGRSQVGVVPVENSSEGHVNITLDEFITTNLKVCGETYLGVAHMLMSKEADLKDIKTLYSHPQPLGQCRHWLSTNLGKVDVVECHSTAEAAQKAAAEPGAAAIGSELLASAHKLRILAGSIQDSPHNMTRFLIIGPQSCSPTGNDKTSVVFSISHTPGSLYDALGNMSQAGLNLTHILSRPMKDRPWEYVFFIDFQGHQNDPEPARAIAGLMEEVAFIKVLGSYPVGNSQETP